MESNKDLSIRNLILELENIEGAIGIVQNTLEERYKSIKNKLNNICDKLGEFKYILIEHTDYGAYRDLDILTKKALIEKLKNTVIIFRGRYGNTVTVLNNTNIDKILENNDLKIRIPFDARKENKLLCKDALWVKFVDENENIVDLREYFKNDTLLEMYMYSKIISYAIINNIKIPKVPFNNEKKYIEVMESIRDKFTDDEIRTIETFGM